MTEKRNLLHALTTVGSMTLVSRIFGFIRDLVIAALFGASAGSDAFLMAFRIPNFMRRLFAEGAFSQAFIPVLSDLKSTHSPEQTHAFVSKVFSNLAVVVLFVSLLGMLFATPIMGLFAPGFSEDSERLVWGAAMLQLTFPYLFFITLVAFAGGVLNANKRFALPAVTPVLLNIALIACALWLSPFLHTPVMSLAWGVLIAGALQLLLQIPALYRIGMLPKFEMDWKDAGVKRVLVLMGPAILGASVIQINLFVDSIFASFLPVGSISWLYYAERLMEFPLGVFGIGLATVMLPNLSESYANKDPKTFQSTIHWSFRLTALLGLPAAAGLILMGEPILATLFGHGAFTNHDVQMTAYSLTMLGLGLPAFIAVKILVRAFYARQKTSYPVKIAVIALISNILLNTMLMPIMQHAGLALASTLSAWLNVSLLYRKLVKDSVLELNHGIWRVGLRSALAVGCLITFLLMGMPDSLWWETVAIKYAVLRLVLLILGGAAVYGIVIWLSGFRRSHLSLRV